MARGMVPLFGISEAMDAAEAAAFIGWAWARAAGAADRHLGMPALPEGGHVTPDEAEAKARLIKAGLPVPKGERAANAVEAVISSMALGFPVALKALGVTHKSEVGAVQAQPQGCRIRQHGRA